MNIDTVIKLVEAGFTKEDLRNLINVKAPEPLVKQEPKKEETTEVKTEEKTEPKKEENKPENELNLNEIKNSIDELKKVIQASNIRLDENTQPKTETMNDILQSIIGGGK